MFLLPFGDYGVPENKYSIQSALIRTFGISKNNELNYMPKMAKMVMFKYC